MSNSGSGTQTFQVSGFPLPKAAFFFLGGGSSATPIAHLLGSIGFANATLQCAIGFQAEDVLASSSTNRYGGNDCCMVQLSETGDTIVRKATFDSFTESGGGGVVVNWSDAGDSRMVTCLLVYGPNLTSTIKRDTHTGTPTATYDVTGLSLFPDLIFGLSTRQSPMNQDRATSGTCSFGFAFDTGAGIAQASNNAFWRDNNSSNSNYLVWSDSAIAATMSTSSGTEALLEVLSIASGQFQVRQNGPAAGAWETFWICLDFGADPPAMTMTVDATPTTTGAYTHDVGHDSELAFLFPVRGTDAAWTDQDGDYSLGIVAEGAGASISWASEDGSADADCQTLADAIPANWPTDDGTASVVAPLIGVDVDGIELDYTTAPGSAQTVVILSLSPVADSGEDILFDDTTFTNATEVSCALTIETPFESVTVENESTISCAMALETPIELDTITNETVITSELDTPNPLDGWYDLAWLFRTRFTVDTSAIVVGADKTDFPVYLRLTIPNVGLKARADGIDLVFTLDNGTTVVPHELKHFDPMTGNFEVWLKLPVSSGSALELLVYYGNQAAADQQDPQEVWSDCLLSCRFRVHPTRALYKNSAAGNSGAWADPIAVTFGGFGPEEIRVNTRTSGGIRFSGSGEHLTCGTENVQLDESTTIIALVRVDQHVDANARIFVKANGATQTEQGHDFALMASSGGTLGRIKTGTSNSTGTITVSSTSGDFALPVAATKLVGVGYNGSNVSLFSGPSVISSAHTGTLRNGTRPVTIGAAPGGGNLFVGVIEELFVFNSAHDADWFETMHNFLLGTGATLFPEENQQQDFGAIVTTGTLITCDLQTNQTPEFAAVLSNISTITCTLETPGQIAGLVPCANPSATVASLLSISAPGRSASAATGQYASSRGVARWNFVRRQCFYQPTILKLGLIAFSPSRQARDWGAGGNQWVAATHRHGIERIKVGLNANSESEMITIDNPTWELNDQSGHIEFVFGIDLSTLLAGASGAKVYRMSAIIFPAKGFPTVVHQEVFIDRDGAKTPTVANGKIRYVANAAMGGDAIGNDSTGTGSKSLPFLTVRKAIEAAASVNGNLADHIEVRVRATGQNYQELGFTSGTFKQTNEAYMVIATAPEDSGVARFSVLTDLRANWQWFRRLECSTLHSGWSANNVQSGANPCRIVAEWCDTHRVSRRPENPGDSNALSLTQRWSDVSVIGRVGYGPARSDWSESYRGRLRLCQNGIYDGVFFRDLLIDNIGSDIFKQNKPSMLTLNVKILNCWADYSDNGFFPATSDPQWGITAGLAHGDVYQNGFGGSWNDNIILGLICLDPEHPSKTPAYGWPTPASSTSRIRFADSSPTAAQGWAMVNCLADGNDSPFRAKIGADSGVTNVDSWLIDSCVGIDYGLTIQGNLTNMAVTNTVFPNVSPNGWGGGTQGLENCHMQTPIGSLATGGGDNSALFTNCPPSTLPFPAGYDGYSRDFSPKIGGPLHADNRPGPVIHAYPVDAYWRPWPAQSGIGAVANVPTGDFTATVANTSIVTCRLGIDLGMRSVVTTATSITCNLTADDPDAFEDTVVDTGTEITCSLVNEIEFRCVASNVSTITCTLSTPSSDFLVPGGPALASVPGSSSWPTTDTPAAVGDSGDTFYAYEALGKFNLVDRVTILDNLTGRHSFRICAKHNSVATSHARQRDFDMGVYRVLVACQGGLVPGEPNNLAGWHEVTEIKMGIDGVFGFEVVMDLTSFSTGWYELRAIVEPVHGVPFVIPAIWVFVDKTTIQGAITTRYVSPTGAGTQDGLTQDNAYSTIEKAWESAGIPVGNSQALLSAGAHTIGPWNSRIDSDGFFVVKPVPGVPRAQCIVRTMNTMNIKRVKFEGLTIDASVGGGVFRARLSSSPNPNGNTSWGQSSGTPTDIIWLHDCVVIGDSGALVAGQYRYWIHEDAYAEVYITGSRNPIPDIFFNTLSGTYAEFRNLKFAIVAAKLVRNVYCLGVVEDGCRFENISNHLITNLAVADTGTPGHTDVMQWILRNFSATHVFVQNVMALKMGGDRVSGPGIQGFFADVSVSDPSDRQLINYAFINFLVDQATAPGGGKTSGYKMGGRNGFYCGVGLHNQDVRWSVHRIDEVPGYGEPPYPGHFGVTVINSYMKRWIYHHQPAPGSSIDPDGCPVGLLSSGLGPRPEWDHDPAVNRWRNTFLYDRNATGYDGPEELGLTIFYPTSGQLLTTKGTASPATHADFADVVADPFTGDMRPAVGGWLDGLAVAGLRTPLPGVQSNAALTTPRVVPFDIFGNRFNPISPSLGPIELNFVNENDFESVLTNVSSISCSLVTETDLSAVVTTGTEVACNLFLDSRMTASIATVTEVICDMAIDPAMRSVVSNVSSVICTLEINTENDLVAIVTNVSSISCTLSVSQDLEIDPIATLTEIDATLVKDIGFRATVSTGTTVGCRINSDKGLRAIVSAGTLITCSLEIPDRFVPGIDPDSGWRIPGFGADRATVPG